MDPVVQRNIDDWAVQQRGLPDDWTHHYLVFSNPGTAQQAIENGRFEEWLKIVDDPRFTLQQIKRSGGAKALEGSGVSPPARQTRKFREPVRQTSCRTPFSRSRRENGKLL